MKRNFINKMIIFSLLSSVFFTSCMTNEVDWDNLTDEFKIDQSLVLPVGEATFTIEDILNSIDTINEFIGADGTQLYYYMNDSINMGQFVKRADVLKPSEPVNSTVSLQPLAMFSPFPPNFDLPRVSNNVDLYLGVNEDPSVQTVTKILANSAKMLLELDKTDLNLPATNILITMKFDKQYIEFDSGLDSINYFPTSYNVPAEIILPAFTMKVPLNANTIPLTFVISANTGTQPLFIESTSALNIKFKFNSIDFKAAYGSFSPTTNLYAETKIIDMDMSDMLPGGLRARLVNPQIDFSVKSDIGIKLGFSVDYFKAYTQGKTDTVTAIFPGNKISKYFEIEAAPTLGSSIMSYPGQFNSTNGELYRLFDGDLPNKLKYRFTVTNVNDGVEDFIPAKPNMMVYYGVKVPLNLKSGSYFELKDTITSVNFDSLLNQDYIDNTTLVLKINNAIPFGVGLKIKLLKADGTEITNTSIVRDYAVNAPVVDENGLVKMDQIVPQIINIAINKSQLPDLRAAKSIAYTLRVENKIGDTERPVYLEKTNSFKVKVGILVKADATINNE